MHALDCTTARRAACRLHFRPLRATSAGYAIPCDADGRVDLDALSAAERNDYLYARAVVGFELEPPTVVRTHH